MTREGFQPTEFLWGTEGTNEKLGRYVTISVLYYGPEPAYRFRFDFRKGGHFAEYRPGHDRAEARGDSGSWDGQLGYFVEWLRNLRRELETQDPWTEVAALQATPTSESPAEDAPLDPKVLEALAGEVKALRGQIDELPDVDARERVVMQDQLTYLMESAERMGWKDLKNAVLGSVMGAILGQMLTVETGKQFWSLLITMMAKVALLLPS